MNINIRLSEPKDYDEVENLTREAFWGLNHPDCDEHFLVHKIRKCSEYIPKLDFVAEIDGKIVGNIIYTRSKVIDKNGNAYETINFGPLSVLPEYKNMGIGKALLNHTIKEARSLGYRGILFYGHPDYYPKVGFQRAEEFNITTSKGMNFDAFMAMPLYEGAFDGIFGKYYEASAFYDITEEEKEKFNEKFPPKEKAVMISAEELISKLSPDAEEALIKNNIKNLCDIRRFSQREVSLWEGIDDDAIETIKKHMAEKGYIWGI